MSWFIDLSSLRKICPSKKGICGYTGKHHITLAGKTPDGLFRTAVAEPYPTRLCLEWSRCFQNAIAARVFDNIREVCN